jgi:NADH dehydrogenase
MDRIQARTKIWSAGVEASPLGRILAHKSRATVDRAGRVSVLPDCTLPGRPEVFEGRIDDELAKGPTEAA